MHAATIWAFRDELLKIAGIMEDAGADYAAMMKKHAPNPAFRAALHPTERPLAYRAMATNKNMTVAADRAQNFTKNPLRLGSVAAHGGAPIDIMSKVKGGSRDCRESYQVRKSMNIVSYVAFHDELEKISLLAEHALDVAGLGVLAAPTVSKHFRDKEWGEKNKRRAELVGLGVLAAHPAYL
jgi:hypothetical protein